MEWTGGWRGEVSHLGEHDQTICVRILRVSRLRNNRVNGLGRGQFLVFEPFSEGTFCTFHHLY